MTKEIEYKKYTNYTLENVPDVGYAKKKLYKRDVFYIKEEPDEIFVNFSGLESKCKKCKLTFPYKSLLHKHLKSSYTEQNQANNTVLVPVPTFSPVIKSIVSIEVVGSRYTFRNCNYATAMVYFTF